VYTYNKLYFQYKKLYSSYLEKITIILNNYHEKKHSKDYWEPIIGLYLRRFISNYLFLNKENKNRLFKKVSYKNSFFHKSYSDYSETENHLFFKFKNIDNCEHYKLKKINFLLEKINTINSIIPNILIKLGITKVLFQESYFRKNLKTLFSLKSNFYFNSLPLVKLGNYKIDREKIFKNRLNLIKLYEVENEQDFLLQNIVFSMPINYVENFKIILNEVKKINLSKALYVDGNEVKFDFIKFYIAELMLKKKKILIGQHSLRTGLEDYDIYFDYSKSISDNYLTWGWDSKLNSIIKYSSIRIFSSLNKYKKVKSIKNNGFNICFILCSFAKIGECFADNYRENLKAEKARVHLLQKIQKQRNCKITLKPRNGSFLVKDKNKFYNKFDILKKKSRMYEIFGNYNIVIFERLSLGIAECIHLNQPTIFYYPKNLYKQKSKEYNNLLLLLKKANIYFDDEKKISKLLNSKTNISLWWNNKKNFENRKTFLKKYANCFEFSHFTKIKKLV